VANGDALDGRLVTLDDNNHYQIDGDTMILQMTLGKQMFLDLNYIDQKIHPFFVD